MHRYLTRQHMQDAPVSGQSPWARVQAACPSASFRNLFLILTPFYQISVVSFSGFARDVGLRSTCSLINWGRSLWSRCFKVFGVFSTAVSIAAEGARFNQEITTPVFFRLLAGSRAFAGKPDNGLRLRGKAL